MSNIVETIKKIAIEAVNASAPSKVLFGEVTQTSPLVITVEQKLVLTREFLVLTKNVTDYVVDVTVNWNTENTALKADHSHTASTNSDISISIDQKNIDLTHKHNISGKKSITIHNALARGDKVTLVQQQGGQKYVVLDKIY